MFYQFKITSYAIIFTLAVVFIIPVDVEAADTPAASPIEKNNTGSWQTGPSSDLKATDVFERSSREYCCAMGEPCCVKGKGNSKSKRVRTLKKVEPNSPEEFPMSEWTPKAKSSAKMKVPEVTRNEITEGETQPQSFPMSEWTPKAKSSVNGANKITPRNEKKR
tara:strand:+ start:96 stop:587 length:492 start_codon:yes stop_codon:yes gene_type:complete